MPTLTSPRVEWIKAKPDSRPYLGHGGRAFFPLDGQVEAQ